MRVTLKGTNFTFYKLLLQYLISNHIEIFDKRQESVKTDNKKTVIFYIIDLEVTSYKSYLEICAKAKQYKYSILQQYRKLDFQDKDVIPENKN